MCSPSMPPVKADRQWVLPSDRAQTTALVCRCLLMVCIAVGGSLHLQAKQEPDDRTPEQIEDDETLWRYTVAMTTFLLAILYGSQGPRWSFFYRIFGMGRPPRHYYRKTYIKRGYEPVAQAFASTLAEGRETGMQFAAYVQGELVVDLVGSMVERQGRDYTVNYDTVGHLLYDSDTYSTIWSSSKVITSILMAWLVDQGHLDYQAKIVEYWPEFTGGGKEHVTVEQLLKHNAGLAIAPPFVMELEHLFPENLPNGNASQVLESMTCWKPPQWTKWLSYHGITRGWILNEIARRVDPQKRTLGVILREEFTEKLNISSECYLGLPEKLNDPDRNPKLRLMDPCPPYLWVICNKLCQLLRIPSTVQWRFYLIHTACVTYAKLHWMPATDFVNPKFIGGYQMTSDPDFRRGETPSANVQATARAVATIANAMATRNPNIFKAGNETTTKAGLNEESRHLMPMILDIDHWAKATFNDGGFCVLAPPAPDNPDKLVKTHIPSLPGFSYAWGWFGFNGSLTAFHPEGDFAVVFQPTAFNDLDPTARVEKMTRALRECGRRLHGDDWGEYHDASVPMY
ncbi:beta-lactamase [Seminavis robusta]|uniref:Beta-lactamase n=1 Tax=Seminavis robusta TaxID=568900 RepID=A0A9N8H5Z8_9STRA|nr:beta-lactamase [Seminavis robusta]|eukprot:Sro99_g050940.1 beta-lactamase (571) ;mRNA; r:72539-74251